MKETELYAPIRDFLVSNGYEVQAEVKNCDIVAKKDDNLIVIEMKTSANLSLLIQATDRQRISDSVYVAIPAPKKRRSSQWRGTQRVLRQLELGLITVNPGSVLHTVQVEFDPMPYQKQKRGRRARAVIQEIHDRSGDYNVGGSTRRELMTAYRESAIQIAYWLSINGPMKPADLRVLGTGEKTTSILAKNHYGWFQRVDRGIYQATAKGMGALEQYPEIVEQLEKQI
jgi:hypothetical protein